VYLLILQAFPGKSVTAQQRKASSRLQICLLLAAIVMGSQPAIAAAAFPWGQTPHAGASAQTGVRPRISGVVVDARTGAPVEKALVKIDDLHVEATTGADGGFALGDVPAGTHQISVSVVGYALARRDVAVRDADVDVRIELTEGATAYSETVTVTAGPFRTATDLAPSAQVLGAAELLNLRGVLADDPLRAVQTLPGVATGDDFRSEFTVRGSDFDHLTFTIDGFATPYVLHTVHVRDRGPAGSIAMINSDVLEDVTLLNGGYAQHYGGHTGAEVDFLMREGSRERRRVSVSVSGADASGVAEGPLGRSGRGSWLVSARQSYLDFLVHHLTSESLSFGFTDAQAKLAYDVTPQQHVTLTLIGGRSRFENDPDLNTANDIAVGLNRSLVAVGAWRWTSGTRTVTQRVLGAANRFRNENPSSADLDRGGERQFGYRADAAAALTSTLLAEAGASVGRNTADSTRLTPIAGIPRAFDDYSGSATEAGAYADVKWTTRRSVVVAPGIRVDRSTLASQFAASPWLQLEAPAGAGRIRASAGVYTQFAGFNEVLTYDGAPDLDPERARQYDAGYERRIGTTSRFSVTAYLRDTPNAIRRAGYEPRVVGNRVVNGNITAAYQNRVSSASRGVEFVFERRVSHGLSGWASYSYSRTRDTDTRTGESFWGDADQRHTFNAYGALRRSERASFVAKLRIGSNFPITGYIAKTAAGYVVTDQRNTARLPVYARLDLRANRTFSVGAHRLTLFAEVLNVLNRDNVRYQPPFINFFTRRAAQPFDTMLPIVPSAGVLIEF
jgi:hypothetical protein